MRPTTSEIESPRASGSATSLQLPSRGEEVDGRAARLRGRSMEGAPGAGDGRGAGGRGTSQAGRQPPHERPPSVGCLQLPLEDVAHRDGLVRAFRRFGLGLGERLRPVPVQCPASARNGHKPGSARFGPCPPRPKKCTICRRLQEQARTGRSRPKPPFQLPKLRVVGSSPIARFEIVPAIARFRRSYARAVKGRGLRGVGWILGVTGLVPASRMPRASAALTICSVPPTTRVYERCTRSSLRPRAARSQTSAGRPRGSGRRRSGADHAGPRPAARLLSRRAVRPFG